MTKITSLKCPKCGNKIAIITPYETFCSKCGYIHHKEETTTLTLKLPKTLHERLQKIMKREKRETIAETLEMLIDLYEDEFIYGLYEDEDWEEVE